MLCLPAAIGPLPLGGAPLAPAPGETVSLNLEAEAARQFQELSWLLNSRDWFAKIAPQAYNAQALIVPFDRDPVDVILRRTAALLADVRRLNPSRNFQEESRP